VGSYWIDQVISACHISPHTHRTSTAGCTLAAVTWASRTVIPSSIVTIRQVGSIGSPTASSVLDNKC
jgi:spore maturation protein SpmA